MTERGRSKVRIVIDAALVVALVGAWVGINREVSALKQAREDTEKSLPALVKATIAETVKSQDYVSRNEWMTDKVAQDAALQSVQSDVHSLVEASNQLLDGQAYARNILGKLPRSVKDTHR